MAAGEEEVPVVVHHMFDSLHLGSLVGDETVTVDLEVMGNYWVEPLVCCKEQSYGILVDRKGAVDGGMVLDDNIPCLVVE